MYSFDCKLKVKGIKKIFFPTLYSSQNVKGSEMENDKIVPKATVVIPEAEQLIAPGTPIQFDIVLPATEFLDQNRGGRYGLIRGVISGRMSFSRPSPPPPETVPFLHRVQVLSIL